MPSQRLRGYGGGFGFGFGFGFTLLELLVALAVFAVIGIAAYSGLKSVLTTRASVEAETQRLNRLQMALYFIERDVEQIVARPVRDEFGQTRPALQGADSDNPLLIFTRDGWDNPLQRPRAGLQRVSYRLDGNVLLRGYWQTLDRAGDNTLNETPLLENVEAVHLRFLDQANRWQRQWPRADQTDAASAGLPRALEISLQLAGWGEIIRLLPLVDG
jgi:general secretion pathway protein J